MKKLMLTCLVLALTSALLGGCRVGGEIDPDGSVSYNGASPR